MYMNRMMRPRYQKQLDNIADFEYNCGTARPRLWRNQYYTPEGLKLNPPFEMGVANLELARRCCYDR